MTFRTIESFEQILNETPPAVRYLDLHWQLAATPDDWQKIRQRMIGAEFAVAKLRPDDAEIYRLLADIAAQHAEYALRVMQPLKLRVAS